MNLDVASGVMEDSMASQMAISTPEDEVSNLMQVRMLPKALAMPALAYQICAVEIARHPERLGVCVMSLLSCLAAVSFIQQ